MQIKHILYISYDGMTDPLGQSQVLPYLIENSKSGYQFSLISFEKKERFEKNKEIIQKICDENSINWHPLNYTKKPPILSTLWDIFKMYLETRKIHSKLKIDLIHCRSYQAAEIGLIMKKKQDIPWIFDMRGFWADERIDGNIWKMSNIIFRNIYKHYKQKEIRFLTDANQIISLTNNAKTEILSWQKNDNHSINFRNKNLNIEVIPCCVNTEHFKNENINISSLSKIREELNIKETQFVLGYVGSIGTWYMLPEMLDFFHILKNKNPNALFLFITNEPSEKIIALAKSKNISPEYLRITSCLHKEVPTYISLFTISIYFIIPAYSKKASSPTKQGELMAMGIPIVCNANVGDADKVIDDTRSGWVIEHFDEPSYISTIEKILTQALPDKQTIISHGNEEFNLQKGALKFRMTYERILNNQE